MVRREGKWPKVPVAITFHGRRALIRGQTNFWLRENFEFPVRVRVSNLLSRLLFQVRPSTISNILGTEVVNEPKSDFPPSAKIDEF